MGQVIARSLALAATLAGLLLAALPARANSPAGLLTCDVAGGVGFIFGSSRDLECTYKPDRGRVEYYSGRINKFGVDLGFTRRSTLIWAVLSPAVARGPGMLTGTYVGVSGQVALGPGVNANALASTSSIILNPVSVGGAQGLNVAAGVTDVDLVYVDRGPAGWR
jgi:hypothetical protein